MPPYHGGLFTLLASARGAQLEGQRLRAGDEQAAAAETAEANRRAMELWLRQRADARAEQQQAAAQGLAERKLAFEMSRPPTPRNIDPLSPEGITAAAERAKVLAPFRAPRRSFARSESTPAPSPRLTARQQSGLARLNTPWPDAAHARRAERHFARLRAAMPTTPPGDLMAEVTRLMADEDRRAAAAAKPQGDAYERFVARQGASPTAAPASAPAAGATGDINLRAPAPVVAPAAAKPVPAADLEHARRDPAFAAWLRERGYAVPEGR